MRNITTIWHFFKQANFTPPYLLEFPTEELSISQQIICNLSGYGKDKEERTGEGKKDCQKGKIPSFSLTSISL